MFFANRELSDDDVLNCAYLGALETLTVKESVRSRHMPATRKEQSETRENEVSIGQSPAERAAVREQGGSHLRTGM